MDNKNIRTMKKPNITEGKWEVIETKDDSLLIVADDLIVCRINELAELTDPNAQAISAVPEMLDALMGAYRIKELWVPDMSTVPVEHEGEAKALFKMKRETEKALQKAGVEF